MVKPEWGLKRKCLKCGTFFYDMRKKEFSCPKCGAKYTLDSYEEMKAKQLAKLAKKSAPKLDDEELDEETLLKMTADVPLGEEMIGEDGLDHTGLPYGFSHRCGNAVCGQPIGNLL